MGEENLDLDRLNLPPLAALRPPFPRHPPHSQLSLYPPSRCRGRRSSRGSLYPRITSGKLARALCTDGNGISTGNGAFTGICALVCVFVCESAGPIVVPVIVPVVVVVVVRAVTVLSGTDEYRYATEPSTTPTLLPSVYVYDVARFGDDSDDTLKRRPRGVVKSSSAGLGGVWEMSKWAKKKGINTVGAYATKKKDQKKDKY
jgi:hypothetical protein